MLTADSLNIGMAPGYWVMDRMALNIDAARVSGPHASVGDAEADMRERNIGEDCEVICVN